MKSSTEEILPLIGTSMGGGYYAGRIRIDGQIYALIVAPKAEGQHEPIPWSRDYADIPGAKSFNDGMANTNAMDEAGSDLAKWARDLRIDGRYDWYLPSQDELEICYRALKPTPRENYCYARSGINLSALPPTRPYLPASPVQTSTEAFRAGGAEAFDNVWYWSSTQHAALSGYAWYQAFNDGYQDDILTHGRLRARAVRRIPIE